MPESLRRITAGSFDDSACINADDSYLFAPLSRTNVCARFNEGGFRVVLRHEQRQSILAGKLVGRADQ